MMNNGMHFRKKPDITDSVKRFGLLKKKTMLRQDVQNNMTWTVTVRQNKVIRHANKKHMRCTLRSETDIDIRNNSLITIIIDMDYRSGTKEC